MSLLENLDAWIISLVLLTGMILSIWIGVAVGKIKARRGSKEEPAKKSADLGTLTNLLFFLLAFTFGMSGSRYEARRGVIIEEANNIGTAILRADLYPEEERTAFRDDFKEYVEIRIAYFEAGFNLKAILYADSMSQVISARIWQRAAQLSKNPERLAATIQMIPAVNAMIDVSTTRLAGEKSKVPETIVWMLFILACVCSFYQGYISMGENKLDWIVTGGFCLLISVVVFITLDLDRGRRGLINLSGSNQTILDLRKNFQ